MFQLVLIANITLLFMKFSKKNNFVLLIFIKKHPFGWEGIRKTVNPPYVLNHTEDFHIVYRRRTAMALPYRLSLHKRGFSALQDRTSHDTSNKNRSE